MTTKDLQILTAYRTNLRNLNASYFQSIAPSVTFNIRAATDYDFVEKIWEAKASGKTAEEALDIAGFTSSAAAVLAATSLAGFGIAAAALFSFFDFNALNSFSVSAAAQQKIIRFRDDILIFDWKDFGFSEDSYRKIFDLLTRTDRARPKCSSFTTDCKKEHLTYSGRADTSLKAVESLANFGVAINSDDQIAINYLIDNDLYDPSQPVQPVSPVIPISGTEKTKLPLIPLSILSFILFKS